MKKGTKVKTEKKSDEMSGKHQTKKNKKKKSGGNGSMQKRSGSVKLFRRFT